MNERFYHSKGYKTKKTIKFLKKKQVNEFIRIKILLILNLHNEKVTFRVFHVKDANKSVR